MIIHTDKLTKKYGDTTVLNELSLSVEPNTIFGFLGPNGAGKSTTIKILLNLVHATSGSAQIFGRDTETESIKIRRDIGYLPQNPQFIRHMTSLELLQFTAKLCSYKPKNLDSRIADILETVELSRKQSRKIKHLSGGEIQRLGLAQAYITKPKLLILDEPAAALDPIGRNSVLKLLGELKEQSTIFFSTHILDDVQRICDNVAILKDGKLLANGPLEDVLRMSNNTVMKINLLGKTSKLIAELEKKYTIEKTQLTQSTQIQIFFENQSIAEKESRNILKTILDSYDVTVQKFTINENELEDIFIYLVNNSG